MGPGPHGRGYIDGDGTPAAGVYLNALWVFSQAGQPDGRAARAAAPSACPSATGNLPVKVGDQREDAGPDQGLEGVGRGRGDHAGLAARPATSPRCSAHPPSATGDVIGLALFPR